MAWVHFVQFHSKHGGRKLESWTLWSISKQFSKEQSTCVARCCIALWCTATAVFTLLLACWISGARCSAHLHPPSINMGNSVRHCAACAFLMTAWRPACLFTKADFRALVRLWAWPTQSFNTCCRRIVQHWLWLNCRRCAIIYRQSNRWLLSSAISSHLCSIERKRKVCAVQRSWREPPKAASRAAAQRSMFNMPSRLAPTAWEQYHKSYVINPKSYVTNEHTNALESLDILATLLGNSVRV